MPCAGAVKAAYVDADASIRTICTINCCLSCTYDCSAIFDARLLTIDWLSRYRQETTEVSGPCRLRKLVSLHRSPSPDQPQQHHSPTQPPLSTHQRTTINQGKRQNKGVAAAGRIWRFWEGVRPGFRALRRSARKRSQCEKNTLRSRQGSRIRSPGKAKQWDYISYAYADYWMASDSIGPYSIPPTTIHP